MDLQLEGKRALVTGSSAGTGVAIAEQLAHEGAAVIVHGRDEGRTVAVRDRLRGTGGTAEAVVGAEAVGPTIQSAGGEDFSWYGEHAPVCYLRLGVAVPGAPAVDLHAGSFDVDDGAVTLGSRILAGAALEALVDLVDPPA